MAHRKVQLFGEDGQPVSGLIQYVDKNIKLFAYSEQFGIGDIDDKDPELPPIEQEVEEPKEPEIYAYFQSGSLPKYSFETRCRFTDDKSRLYFYIPAPMLMEDKDIIITYSVKRGKTEISLFESKLDIRPHKPPIFFSTKDDLEEIINRYEIKLKDYKENLDILFYEIEDKFFEYDDVFQRVDAIESLVEKETIKIYEILEEVDYELEAVRHSLDDYATVEDTEALKKEILDTIDGLEDKYVTLTAYEIFQVEVENAFYQNDIEHEELRKRIEEAHTILTERLSENEKILEEIASIKETLDEHELKMDDFIDYDTFKGEVDRRSANDLALTQRINSVQSKLVDMLDEAIEEVENAHTYIDNRLDNLEAIDHSKFLTEETVGDISAQMKGFVNEDPDTYTFVIDKNGDLFVIVKEAGDDGA